MITYGSKIVIMPLREEVKRFEEIPLIIEFFLLHFPNHVPVMVPIEASELTLLDGGYGGSRTCTCLNQCQFPERVTRHKYIHLVHTTPFRLVDIDTHTSTQHDVEGCTFL